MESHERGEVLTGIFYIDPKKPSFIDLLNIVDEPLGQLESARTRPGKPVLDEIMARLR
jgi:2-oxoglutarate ferredoxin oxidoreductase subunit beta